MFKLSNIKHHEYLNGWKDRLYKILKQSHKSQKSLKNFSLALYRNPVYIMLGIWKYETIILYLIRNILYSFPH